MKHGGVVVSGIVLLAVMVLATPVVAGDLNPPGAPAPTMKTLDQIPPTWDQTLPSDNGPTNDGCNSSRFKCVMGGAAVLDKETGLVWEETPGLYAPQLDWSGAQLHCITNPTGGRRGWRLPTIAELMSLTDPSGSPVTLPAGHPFTGVQASFYWSASTWPSDASLGWSVLLSEGLAIAAQSKTSQLYWWCVRGGRSNDSQ